MCCKKLNGLFDKNGILVIFSNYFFFFSGCTFQSVGSLFPDQGSNPCPLQWKHSVLTTGPLDTGPVPWSFSSFNGDSNLDRVHVCACLCV